MRTLILFLFVVVVIAGAIAVAISLLPWWLSLTLFLLILAPAAWILLKIRRFIKSLTSTLGQMFQRRGAEDAEKRGVMSGE